MKSSFITVAVTVLALGTAGGLGRALVAPTRAALRLRQSSWRVDFPDGAAGLVRGGALLGGFRTLAADFLWLRVNVLWEKRDLPGTMQNLRLVTALDPRPLVFWLNGARMMAYDMPAWRVAALGGRAVGAGGVARRIESDQAHLALAWLDAALKFHPASPAVFIERANIRINCLHDPAAAAEEYRRAAGQPGAPRYAARLHAEMLRRAGRKTEALAWLVALHAGLPRNDEAAAADLVLARIRDLEAELGIPPGESYRVQEL